MRKLILSAVLILCLSFCFGLASCKDNSGSATTVPPDTEPAEHEHVWDEGRVIKEGTCDPTTKEETKGEIMFTCTICGEQKKEECDGHDWYEKQIIDSATCLSSGMALYECRRCSKRTTKVIPINPSAHQVESGEGRIVSVPTANRDGVREWVCTRCGKAGKTVAVTNDEYVAAMTAIKTKVNSFVSSDFGSGTVRSDLGGSYAVPSVHPTKGQHPRVLFTSESIEGMKEELYDKRSTAASTLFRQGVRNPTDGVLEETPFDKVDTEIFRNMQTLALDYQLTGNKISGYNAVYALKNALKTLTDSWTGQDDVAHRYYGFAMYVAACVYDWCYDLLTTTDKEQIILGVQEKICKVGMTVTYAVGFPPTGADAVSGHGTGFMILRDYLAFAIAIYDEYPGWWNMIAGRFYEEYVPVRNTIYEAGMIPQGVSLYVRSKYFPELFSAWLVKAATGVFPYASEANMKQIARTIFSYELRVNNGALYGFASGDDQTPYGVFLDYGHIALVSSYLFNDSTMRAQLEHNYQSGGNPTNLPYGSSYRNFSGDITETASIAEYLICSSSGLEKAADRHEGMDLILYNGGWLGQIIARNTWERSQAAVLMKIGQRTVANHDHYDAGSFQIFYKAMLAGDSGVYDGYGSNHHKYYHQATIAHNSLLIYNTNLSSTYSGYYSGGQQRLNDANISNWQSSTYKTGDVTGVSYGYADQAKTTPTYAYLAGNIAAAYPSSTVSEVTRRMLVVYDTDDAQVPMYFFVFDNITSDSGSYKKTFLLHTRTEPYVPDGYTASDKIMQVNNGGATLRIQNVIGNNVTFTTHGGDNQNYLIDRYNDGQYVQLNSTNSKDDNYWGRLEISPAIGNTTDQLLHAMYVFDTADAVDLVATAIDTAVVKGAAIGNTVAVFVTDATRRDTEFTFTASGSGTRKYYVSGVEAGDWTVLVGGLAVSAATATEDGGFLTFAAPAGVEITLRPGAPKISVDDGLPDNGWDEFGFSNLVP